MPKAVVKGKEQERYWRECKESVGNSHPELDKNDNGFYELVMGCFYRRVHRKGGSKDYNYKTQYRTTSKKYA